MERGSWWKEGKRWLDSSIHSGSTWWVYIILDLQVFKPSSYFESIKSTKPTGEQVVKNIKGCEKAAIFFCSAAWGYKSRGVMMTQCCNSEWAQTKPVQLSCSQQIPDPFHNTQKTSDPVLTGDEVLFLESVKCSCFHNSRIQKWCWGMEVGPTRVGGPWQWWQVHRGPGFRPLWNLKVLFPWKDCQHCLQRNGVQWTEQEMLGACNTACDCRVMATSQRWPGTGGDSQLYSVVKFIEGRDRRWWDSPKGEANSKVQSHVYYDHSLISISHS